MNLATIVGPALGATMMITLAAQAAAEDGLSLFQAVTLAQEADPWQQGSLHREQALSETSVAASALPDPRVTLGAANLPVDDPGLTSQPMTQLVVGVSQTFPRGDSLALRSQQLNQEQARLALLREDRLASVAVTVSELWLDAYLNDESLRLIRADRVLFEHLVDTATAKYGRGIDSTRQVDLVRATLELTRLDDRLTMLEQNRETTLAALAEWLPDTVVAQLAPRTGLPQLELDPGVARAVVDGGDAQTLLLTHPRVLALEQRLAASDSAIELARQKYRPEWSVSASYGYRDDDPFGNDRSDFFSLGVGFDLPLFTADRQDRQLAAARSTRAAVATDRQLLLRSLQGRFDTARARLEYLDRRQALYQGQLLEQMRAQADAALSAYINDRGDFAETVRAHIAELDAKLELLTIQVARLKTIAALNYFAADTTTTGRDIR